MSTSDREIKEKKYLAADTENCQMNVNPLFFQKQPFASGLCARGGESEGRFWDFAPSDPSKEQAVLVCSQ